MLAIFTEIQNSQIITVEGYLHPVYNFHTLFISF